MEWEAEVVSRVGLFNASIFFEVVGFGVMSLGASYFFLCKGGSVFKSNEMGLSQRLLTSTVYYLVKFVPFGVERWTEFAYLLVTFFLRFSYEVLF